MNLRKCLYVFLLALYILFCASCSKEAGSFANSKQRKTVLPAEVQREQIEFEEIVQRSQVAFVGKLIRKYAY